MKRKLLSPEQAFHAMIVFLEEYYKRTSPDVHLGDVLGDVQLNKTDAMPADPAAWDDWLAAVNTVLPERTGAGERATSRRQMP